MRSPGRCGVWVGNGGEEGGMTGDQVARKGREREREGGGRKREKQRLLDNAVLIRSHHANGSRSRHFSFSADRELQP